MNPVWDPAQYARYAEQRLQPALDLIHRIPLDFAESITDLGCGRGNVAHHLLEQWPGASYHGVDVDEHMLESARTAHPELHFSQADISNWTAEEPPDLIYSNAALQWVPDHQALLPRLVSQLGPGGALAVQIPYTYSMPVHLEMRAQAEAWSGPLDGFLIDWAVLELDDYYRILAPITNELQLWETTYVQVLDGEHAAFEWIRGSGLRPYLQRLEGSELHQFEDEFRERMDAAYPTQSDGHTLLPYRRLFFVAVR